ncbi:hypothetical protein [Pelagicoccus sp. SDUM812002]|uniref:hypothetical protein n=1 Tax=Pelagicoccus sp. SDUM812002 TaxID=3041266 RepID=UPI00280CF96B|nr:hypothetical protein [Pelagicoccus sp. SDUM812002]MDQ8187365.1 hypothetical protein [Pelagicoccus sp. SDUM812002]
MPSSNSLMMSHTLMLTQALFALMGLYGAAWFLLNSRGGANSHRFILAGIVNFAAASYLLCCLAFPLLGLREALDQYPFDPFIWIAFVTIAFSAIVQQVAGRTLRKAIPPPSLEPPPDRTAASDGRSAEDSENAFERHVLLLGLQEHDSRLTAKLLSNIGFTVMIEDSPNDLLYYDFQQSNVHLSILFNRDGADEVPTLITRLANQHEDGVTLIALTRDPRSPHIQREIRNHRYHVATGSPLKAMELFQIIDCQRSSALCRMQPYHPNIT